MMTNNKKRHTKPRKSGGRSRKPKFLSLRLQFPANQIADVSREEYREPQEAENVALFFSEGDGGATSLDGLLDVSAAESNSPPANSNSSRTPVPAPPSVPQSALVRSAMRSRGRDSRSVEKWVQYSEVVEKKKVSPLKEEEVSSSSAVDLRKQPPSDAPPLLKLDYEEIMNAWSDKGPLYVEPETTTTTASQIVPDINNDVVSHEASNINEGLGFWAVPEMAENAEMTREMKTWIREASVLRYKEKRRNRLFHKKIRYQVRKLNAEKRPRIKGRFVKKS